MNADARTIRDWDKRYLWHPFTPMADWTASEPLAIVAGEGEWLIDADGNRYLDGVSSLWCNLHGHRRKEIDDAIRNQLERIAHSTLLGLANPPSAELAKRLIDLAPEGLSRVFYSDSGSTAVEIALKLAYQYWQLRGQRRRQTFIALRQSYHGDTLGAVSVGGIDLFHKTFSSLVFTPLLAPCPNCYRCELGLEPSSCGMVCADRLEEILSDHAGQVCAVIVEPMIQGAGGMLTAPPGYLRRIREITRSHDTLLIADEVATGFGRTGKMFACENEQVCPDLMCLGKGISGGYLPLAATLVAEPLYNTFLGHTFYHGHTYTGNALACAAGLASLDIFEKDAVLDTLPDKIERLRSKLAQIRHLPHVGDVRQCGLMAGIELVRNVGTKEPFDYAEGIGAKLCHTCRPHGVLLRPLSDVIVIVPPLCISQTNLDRITDTVAEVIEQFF